TDAAGVARCRHPDAFGLPEKAFRAPEAAEAEHRSLESLGVGALQAAFGDEMLLRSRYGPIAARQRLAGLRHLKLLVQLVAEEKHAFLLLLLHGHFRWPVAR